MAKLVGSAGMSHHTHPRTTPSWSDQLHDLNTPHYLVVNLAV
jgi:hypothetical protein